jgi:hypothetical protein
MTFKQTESFSTAAVNGREGGEGVDLVTPPVIYSVARGVGRLRGWP